MLMTFSRNISEDILDCIQLTPEHTKTFIKQRRNIL